MDTTATTTAATPTPAARDVRSGAGTGRRLLAAGLAVALGCAGCSTGDDQPGPDGADHGQASTRAGGDGQAMPDPTDGPDPTGADAPAGTPVAQVGQAPGLSDSSYVPLDPSQLSTHVDDSDPTSVLTGGLEASFAWRPATDSTQFDAFERAQSVWNNTWLSDNQVRLATLVPMSSRAWADWGDKNTEFAPEVSVLADQHPADTGTDFSRVVKIDQVTTGGIVPGRRVLSLIATVRVHKSDLGWRLDNLNVIDNLQGDR